MDNFAGLDVSVKETSVCIVDDTGRIVREVKVASEPEALPGVLMQALLATGSDTIIFNANAAITVASVNVANLQFINNQNGFTSIY